MSRFRWNLRTGALVVAVSASLGAQAGHAQLVVTEFLANPISANDATWEWIEVKNTGATPINLDGYIAAKLN